MIGVRRHRRGMTGLALLCLLACLPLAGCGPLGGGDDDPADAAEKVVDQFADAINSDDFETVCGLLDSEAIASIEKGAKGSCARSLSDDAKNTPADLRVVVDQVRVAEDRGTADITIRVFKPGKDRKVLTSRPQSLLLVMEDGDWKVASPI